MSEIIVNQPRDRGISDGSDTEFDPQFKPIVNLPEVEVLTNEENETVLLKLRAKLYRFDTNSDPSEWKERGTGELKILQHNHNNSVRIVMRRDKTFKVCANHFITPWMILKPCSGSEKAFLYTVAADFADEKPKSECLALKFGSVDNANLFKSKFEEAKVIVSEKCFLYNGQCEEENGSTNLNNKDIEEQEVTQKMAELGVNKKVCGDDETK
ncbi:ran-specific GTPase-activating protein [Asbolus verrucosus]|uniref:Ran-specific GTPase-activating protein n=1 Tax=Asbolus verrucosus TaxID=1661398 RepID=A0A482VU80_ASBVE|nr:ran-specific GTPase-activating protein [Asbolus verrucosus]